MSEEESPLPEDILMSATEQLDEEEISLADNEEILQALSELTPVYENDRSYFVLGNYDREPIRRLNLIVDRLNRRTDAYAFRMVDIRGEWDNSIQKFCLIADIVTYLVGVAEKEPSDFLVEQGSSSARWSTSRRATSSSGSTRTKRTRSAGCRTVSSSCSTMRTASIAGEPKRTSSRCPANCREFGVEPNRYWHCRLWPHRGAGVGRPKQ